MTELVSIRDLKVEATSDAGRRIEIIKGVSFEVKEGEIVSLIGESGSGKSTIALSLMGYARTGCRISGGEVMLDGRNVARMGERARAGMRGAVVSYIPQSAAAAFNPAHRILTQVVETARIHDLMSEAAAKARAIELFRALALPEPETIGFRYPHQVSGGQLQRLAAAMALITHPKLVIFDEPTTALDVTTQVEVLRAFKAVMRERGIAGVYVSHDLAVVAQVADRIIVLKDGAVQEEGATGQILHHARHPYTRELLAAFHPSPRAGEPIETNPAAETPLLDVSDLVVGYGGLKADGMPQITAVKNVSLRLEKGRNLGIIGESGSGKSTLARAVAGLLPPASGKVSFEGRMLAPSAGKRSRQDLRDIQIVFQYADTALNPAHIISDILGRPLKFFHGLRGSEQDVRINQLLDMVKLPRALRDRRPAELSGGQKQRVNLARALAAEPKLILCDEVTSALDTVVAAAVIDLLKELQRELGLSYLFISHDLSTVRAICDEAAVMYCGEKVEQLTPAKMDSGGQHPYTRLLFSSVPKLDPRWLDSFEHDREAVSAA
ncbi:ABC transporter ATP-binding protein [Chelativorans salis]|uniref:ABC transporter ATP-binding protein n=1 Tax=Chelativorans salis TaxID=2978478 RepID=A0ABT2LU95_9HYPH|nr:ABC transporter ATP-binding protein [Chelativorans sp. EGI FJ00035]MCT7378105.1 ABC transporter ATP-binding protein [Chelativorans sp. EGI FJ00035]